VPAMAAFSWRVRTRRLEAAVSAWSPQPSLHPYFDGGGVEPPLWYVATFQSGKPIKPPHSKGFI
jgi:hypothetical protein